VAKFIEPKIGIWDESMVRSLFDDQRVKEILETPIGLPTTEDKLVWMDNKSGSYTVKGSFFTIRDG